MCVCMFMCVCMYVCMYVYIYLYMYMYPCIRMYTCADTFRHLLLLAVAPGLQPIRRWHLPPHQNRRKPLQPCTIPRQDQDTPCIDQRHALRRQRCSRLHTRLQGVWSDHQPEEEQNLGQDISSTPSISINDLEVVEISLALVPASQATFP